MGISRTIRKKIRRARKKIKLGIHKAIRNHNAITGVMIGQLLITIIIVYHNIKIDNFFTANMFLILLVLYYIAIMHNGKRYKKYHAQTKRRYTKFKKWNENQYDAIILKIIDNIKN